MRRLLLALPFFAMAIVPALAADVEPELIEGVPDWTGFYAGAHIGRVNLDPEGDVVDFVTELLGLGFDEDRGPHGGVLAGYRAQIKRLVLGIEADVGFGEFSKNNERLCTNSSVNCANNGAIFRGDATGHLRASAGLLLTDQVLVFVTAGLAVARMEMGIFSEASGGGITDFDKDIEGETLLGNTFGAGIEVKPLENISIRAEVLADNFSDEISGDFQTSAEAPPCCAAAFNLSDVSTEFEQVIARLALIWNF
jgi:outer membrane immunogenic protein